MRSNQFKKIPAAFFPWLLLGTRAILGPVMLIGALLGISPIFFTLGLWIGVITDIFDGMLARKLGCATDTMRLRDSQIDLVFFVCLGGVAFWKFGSALHPWIIQISLLIFMQVLEYVVSLLRFGKTPSSHAYAFKFFAITLLAAFTDLFQFDRASWLFGIALTTGFLAHLDSLLILAIMPRWQRDVPSAYHAWRIKHGLPIKLHRWFHSD